MENNTVILTKQDSQSKINSIVSLVGDAVDSVMVYHACDRSSNPAKKITSIRY